MKIYNKKNISTRIGRPLRTVTQWLDSGFIVPDVEASRGKGKPRLFSQRNLIEFGMFDLMSGEMGIPQSEIRDILSRIKGLEQLNFGLGSEEIPFPDNRDVEDFYSSKEWGKTKELIYKKSRSLMQRVDESASSVVEEAGYFEIVELKERKAAHLTQWDGTENYFEVRIDRVNDDFRGARSFCEVVYWLGLVRNVAIGRLRIKI